MSRWIRHVAAQASWSATVYALPETACLPPLCAMFVISPFAVLAEFSFNFSDLLGAVQRDFHSSRKISFFERSLR